MSHYGQGVYTLDSYVRQDVRHEKSASGRARAMSSGNRALLLAAIAEALARVGRVPQREVDELCHGRPGCARIAASDRLVDMLVIREGVAQLARVPALVECRPRDR